MDSCPKASSSPLTTRRLYICRERGLHAETAVSSDGQLEVGNQWSDQHHLDYFKHS